ncbi:MAG: hypothetical protein ACLUR5_03600 [Eubacterium ventriosum]
MQSDCNKSSTGTKTRSTNTDCMIFQRDKVLKKDEPKESDKAKIISFSDYWNEEIPEERNR